MNRPSTLIMSAAQLYSNYRSVFGLAQHGQRNNWDAPNRLVGIGVMTSAIIRGAWHARPRPPFGAGAWRPPLSLRWPQDCKGWLSPNCSAA